MKRTMLRLRASPKRLIPLLLAAMPLLGAQAQENCCVQPFSYFDCTGSGHIASPGKLYTCVDMSSLAGCMSCLVEDNDSLGSCAKCCTIQEDIECQKLESEWEFYASTLFFICLCCCFTALCGFTEVRRKKKGISFAQAWSVPQAMPILRTWPRRPLSASDVTEAADGSTGSDAGQHWAPLSDDEEDLKKYPVAGLVDDSGMAFGFVTSMPQSLLSSVATSLRRSGTPNPPSPQEPELTVWISRDSGGTSALTSSTYHTGPISAVEATRPGSSNDRSSGGDERQGMGQQRAVVVGNDLEEPLMLDEVGAGAGTETGRARRETVQTGLTVGSSTAAEPSSVAATT